MNPTRRFRRTFGLSEKQVIPVPPVLHLQLVTCVGGNDGTGVVKRLNYVVKDSIPGGQNFSETCDITSVHWGAGETGSVDQAKSSANTKVTILFSCPGNSEAAGVTFTPLLGLDL